MEKTKLQKTSTTNPPSGVPKSLAPVHLTICSRYDDTDSLPFATVHPNLCVLNPSPFMDRLENTK